VVAVHNGRSRPSHVLKFIPLMTLRFPPRQTHAAAISYLTFAAENARGLTSKGLRQSVARLMGDF